MGKLNLIAFQFSGVQSQDAMDQVTQLENFYRTEGK